MNSGKRCGICAGTYVKGVRFSEPTNPDGFIILYLRPDGRFLFVGYWRGYEKSFAAGYWRANNSELELDGFGSVRADSGEHTGRFLQKLALELNYYTPMLVVAKEAEGWSLLSWLGAYSYIGEDTVLPLGGALPNSLPEVDECIAGQMAAGS